MPVPIDRDDNDALLRRVEQSTAQIERLAADLQRGGIERAVRTAIGRSHKALERQLTNMLRQTLLSAFGLNSKSGLGSLIGRVIPGFARGGVINSRTILAGAGEAGPEVVLPLRKTADGRLGVAAAAPQSRRQTQIQSQAPRHIEVTIRQDTASPIPQDEEFQDAVATAVADALDGMIDDRIALHMRGGGLLNHASRQGGWQ